MQNANARMSEAAPAITSPPTRHRNGTTGHRAVRGAAIFAAASYLSILLGIAARKWLAVLVLPAVYGLIQAALSFVDLVFSFSAFSFSSAIINVRENLIEQPLEDLQENILLLTALLNGGLAVIAMMLGVIFAHELGGYVVLGLIGVYVVQRVTSAFDTFYSQMLERELEYKRVSSISLIANIVLHAGSVLIALAGWPVWSIPVATLLSAIVSASINRVSTKRFKLHLLRAKPWQHYNARTTRWLLRFGTNVFFNRLFESWLFRVDNMLVLAFLGTATLGVYAQAFAIAQLPAMALAPIVARVSIATYASVQHETAKLEEAFRITNFFLIRLLVPAALVVLFAAPDAVRIFLSSTWLPSAAPLMALTGFVLTIPLFENAKMLLGAKLRLKEISIVRATQLALLVLGIIAFATSSAMRVGIVVSMVSVIGYLMIVAYVRRDVRLFVMDVFLYPVVIGIGALIALRVAIYPGIIQMIPVEGSIRSATIRLVVLAVGIPLMTLGLEMILRRKPILETLGIVRMHYRKK